MRINKDIMTFIALIEDIINEARIKENNKALSSLTLYGNKLKD